jgi:hypothetical protein
MLIQTDHVSHGGLPRCNFAWKLYADGLRCQAWLIPIHVHVRGT